MALNPSNSSNFEQLALKGINNGLLPPSACTEVVRFADNCHPCQDDNHMQL